MKKASKKISEGLAKIGIAPPKEGEIKHITEEEMKLAQEIEDTGTEVETSDIEPNLFMSAEKRAEIMANATQDVPDKNLVQASLDAGGSIHPLLVNSEETGGLGLCNPSIYDDGDDNFLVVVRNVSYTLHHNEGEQRFQTPWGPLNYVRPDNDPTLKTTNFVGRLNKNGKAIGNNEIGVHWIHKVDTSKFDKPPVWEFHGLEDARIVRWKDQNGKKQLYICGCRRDVKEDGESRMEMSRIKLTKKACKETFRHRIQSPVDKNAYCEKNWMPVTDLDNTFVKWANPLEVVQAYPRTEGYRNSSEVIVKAHPSSTLNLPYDPRGSSQVIPWKDYRICVVHDVAFWHNEKGDRDAIYWHRFVVWDKDWNLITMSRPWKFMDGRIEFCCGMAADGDDLLITFGYQDNAAYLVRTPEKVFEEFLGVNL